MARKGYQIKQDGRTYHFIPGKDGSLMAKNTQPDGSMLNPIQKRAKGVPGNPFTPRGARAAGEVGTLTENDIKRKKRAGIAKSISIYD